MIGHLYSYNLNPLFTTLYAGGPQTLKDSGRISRKVLAVEKDGNF